jgi:hypothetical protein
VSDIQRLIDIEAIKQLKARYFRFMDTKDWMGFGSVFTLDARLMVRRPPLTSPAGARWSRSRDPIPRPGRISELRLSRIRIDPLM